MNGNVAELEPPPKLDFFKEKPFLHGGRLNLFELRLRHGTDVLILFQADPVGKNVRIVAESLFNGTNLQDEGRIQRTSNVVKSISLDDWRQLYARTRYGLGERTASFDRDALNQWLAGRVGGDDGPHSAGVGWLSENDDFPAIFFFAAWMTDGYKIVYPMNVAVERLFNALAVRGASDPQTSVVSLPIDDEHGGSVDQLNWEGTTYPLRRNLRWVFDRVAAHLDLDGFSPGFVGAGTNPQRSWEVLLSRLHQYFQALHRTRTRDRSEEQDRRWRLLRRLIDVDAYRDQTSMRMTKVGRIARIKPGEVIVAWVDQREAERVPLDGRVAGSDKLKKLAVGAWFRAVVLCHPRNQELRSIETCDEDPSLNVTKEQAQDYWKKIVESRRRAKPPTGEPPN